MKYPNIRSVSPRVGMLALGAPFLFSLAQPAPQPSDDVDCCDEASSIESMAPPALLDGTVIQSSGAIEADLEAFRALLGNPINGTAPGQQLTGHREINWDAVPAAVTNVTNFPPAFFNTNSTRGLVYTPASHDLEVSDRRFTDINPTYEAEFNPFSGQKLFSPIGHTKADVHFFVAGSDTEAAVKGFGAVFMDVDQEGSSGLVVFGEDGRPLAKLLAPVRSDARGASFVGVVFPEPVIGRVRIVSGNGRLAPGKDDVSQGGERDLVVLDDFLYGEPTATGN